MNVLIVEDEIRVADGLIRQLRSIEPGLEIMDVISTVKETVEFLKGNTPDLIFMDIHLTDGRSFEIIRRTQLKVPVIFVTAGDRNLTRMFKKKGIHFLLKPVDMNELQSVLQKYKNSKDPMTDFSVDPGILDPRVTYENASQWEEKARKLSGLFIENFEQFTDNEEGRALVAAGPQL